MKKYERYYTELEPIAKICGIKLAPLEDMLAFYPSQFIGMEFYEVDRGGAKEPRAKYSEKTQSQLIKAFHSHEWRVYSDIYCGQFSKGGSCKKCGRTFKFPEGDYTDDFILTYHYFYGSKKEFGGRITKCKGKKK